MRRIKLAKYGDALIDDDDYEYLSQFKWHLTARGYVAHTTWAKGRPGTMYMHRAIMKTPEGFDTDHKDMNKLNNQKANLRICTRSENMGNSRRKKKLGAYSKYIGVSKFDRPNLKKPWVACIRKDGKQIHLGYFATPEEAAKAYDRKATELFGEYATINVVA